MFGAPIIAGFGAAIMASRRNTGSVGKFCKKVVSGEFCKNR